VVPFKPFERKVLKEDERTIMVRGEEV